MKLKHRFTVPAPIDEAWAAFNDVERVAPCFPGASLTSVDGDQFSGTVKIKLGPISMQYSGTGTFLERDETNHTARLEAKGKDKRGNGTANANVTAQLTAEGDETAVEVNTDLAITGKPAQFGRGVIQDVSDKLLGKFTVCLAQTLGPAAEQPADEPRVEEPAPAPNPQQSTPAPIPASSSSSSAAAASSSSPRAATSGPPTAPRSAGAPSAAETSAADDDEGLDLIRTVAPVLLRRYALPVGGALLALLVLIRIIRR